VRNVTELIRQRIQPSAPSSNGTPFLPLDLRRWHSRRNERFLALGYAELDLPQD
jgi:hypothetical protein